MNLQLAQYPFLRIVIPLILGNAMALLSLPPYLFFLSSALSVIFLIWYAATKEPLKKYKLNKLYPIPLFLLLLSLGWLNGYVNKPSCINDKYVGKPIFITAEVEEAKHGNVTLNTISSAIINNNEEKLSIVFQGNDYKIKQGSIIRCRLTLDKIMPSVVPYSFDYAQYLKSKGILYRGFVEEGNYIIIGEHNNIFTAANSIRNSIIKSIFSCGFSDDTANFLITILTGDNQFLDDETKISFSHSGLAHILAVSGLHIAIISIIIAFALSFLDRLKMKWMRLTISLIFVWAFCFITGLSPSSVRASIMATFLITAILSHKKHNTTNALAAAAVITLIIDPFAISDIGFQLSYLSVATIVILANSMTIGGRFSWEKKISELFAVSIAAQLGTCFISILYFKVLPLSFIIANVIIVPILPFFVISAILAILLSVIGVNIGFIPACINTFYDGIRYIADFCSGIDIMTFDNIWLTPIAAISFTLVIISIGLWLRNRNETYLIWVASVFTAIAFTDLTYQICTTPRQGYFISDEYESTNIVALDNNELFIINSNNDSLEIANFLERQKALLYRLGINKTHFITDDFQNSILAHHKSHSYFNGKTFIFANGNYRKKTIQKKRLHIDYAIITSHFYGSINDLEKIYEISTYILPKEIYKNKRLELAKELELLEKDFIDMSKGGKCEEGFS